MQLVLLVSRNQLCTSSSKQCKPARAVLLTGHYNNKCDIWSLGVIVYMPSGFNGLGLRLRLGVGPDDVAFSGSSVASRHFYDGHCDDWTMQKILNEPLDVYGGLPEHGNWGPEKCCRR